MKKILLILVIALVAFYGYKVYEKNKAATDEVKEQYVLDENYVLAFSFEDDLINRLVKKTYYIYNNEKAVLESVYTERSTGNYIETKYKDITIDDKSFDVNSIISEVPHVLSTGEDSQSMSNIYRYSFYIKDTQKTYRLKKTEANTKKLLLLFGEISE